MDRQSNWGGAYLCWKVEPQNKVKEEEEEEEEKEKCDVAGI